MILGNFQIKLFARTLVLVVILFLCGCATNPATGRSQLALMSMSAEEEVSIGKNMFPKVVQKMGGEYPDVELQNYIQAVGHRLKESGYRKDIDYTFKVVNESAPNAFAMPGGYVAITRGLLLSLESEEQLAAVLGHEIGHVDARHALQGLQRSNLLDLGLAVLSGVAGSSQYAGLIRSSGDVAATLVDRSYSRGQEEESDRLGIDYMVKSGYDPQGAVELQNIFNQKIDSRKDPGWIEGLFRTHPFSKKRFEKNRAYIVANYPDIRIADDGNSNGFMSATKRLRNAGPAYEKYDQARKVEKGESPEKAIGLYLEAAALAPEEALILTGLGLAYLRLEDSVSAKQHLARAVKLDGNYYLSRLGLAYSYLNKGNFTKTIYHAEKSFLMLPTVEAAYLSARGHDGDGQSEKAIELYRVVENTAPETRMGKHAAARIINLEGS